MIDDVAITDLGVIRAAHLELSSGFTALTGETGAGKTMVVTALGLLSGARADSSSVRAGEQRATVEGRFSDVPDSVAEAVESSGGVLDEGELLLVRQVQADGRSRAYAGGRAVPSSLLSSFATDMVTIHGQSDQVRLVSTSSQRALLDRFAGAELAEALDSYRRLYAEWMRLRDRVADLEAHRASARAETADLRMTLEAIGEVSPQSGEDAALVERIGVLSHAERLQQSLAEASEALHGDDDGDGAPGSITLLEAARQAVARAAELDASLRPVADALTDLRYTLEDAASEITERRSALDAVDPQELDAAQERLSSLRALERRFGPELDDVLAREQAALRRLAELEAQDAADDDLAVRASEAETAARNAAQVVSELRSRAAEALGREVTRELVALAMPDARLSVVVERGESLGADGLDTVEMLLVPHLGAVPRPLAKGASGGELSRVMLAIEVVLAGSERGRTFVFDEVDSGVGGSAAIEIGRRLALLARTQQVIVVTHLPQVAAYADVQLQISKDVEDGSTVSSVHALDEQERVRELARMLSGLAHSKTGVAHAAELLATARAEKAGSGGS